MVKFKRETKHLGNIELLTKPQKQFLSNILSGTSSRSERAYKDFLKEPEQPDMLSRQRLEQFLLIDSLRKYFQ